MAGIYDRIGNDFPVHYVHALLTLVATSDISKQQALSALNDVVNEPLDQQTIVDVDGLADNVLVGSNQDRVNELLIQHAYMMARERENPDLTENVFRNRLNIPL